MRSIRSVSLNSTPIHPWIDRVDLRLHGLVAMLKAIQ